MAKITSLAIFLVFALIVIGVFLIWVKIMLRLKRKSVEAREKQHQGLIQKGFSIDYTPPQSILEDIKSLIPYKFGVRQQRIHLILRGNYRGRVWNIADYSYLVGVTSLTLSREHYLIFSTPLDIEKRGISSVKTSRFNLPVIAKENKFGTHERDHVVYYQGIEQYLDDISNTLDKIEKVSA